MIRTMIYPMSLALCLLPSPARAAEPEDSARKALAQLVAQDFAAVHARFGKEMLAAVPMPAMLGGVWQQFAGSLGKFQRVDSVDTAKRGGFDVATLHAVFEKGRLDVLVSFDHEGKIGGLFFPPVAQPWSAPPYVAADRFDERDVSVGAPPFALHGKLTVPRGAGPFPAVVLVHGSGSSDEDETYGQVKPFRDLAWGLSSRGVAVLRYPKRSFVYPKAFAAPARFTVREEAIDDARAAVALLAATEKIDARRIFVAGHSLGGMLAPRIATGEPRVGGLVILAGATRPLEDLVVEQLKAHGRPADVAAAEASRARIRDPKLADTDWVEFLGQQISAGYFLDLRGYHPADVAARLDVPILVLQGDRDLQVRRADYDGWQRALGSKARTRLVLYPTLTHLFIEGEGTLADYEKPGHVAPRVIEDVATFVRGGAK